MSGITLAVSVEDLPFEAWGTDFHKRIAALPQDLGLSSEVSVGAGTVGAKRRPSVKVRSAEPAGERDVIKVLGLVVSSLSLAVASAQFVINQNGGDAVQPPPMPVFVCRVEGPKGVQELRIEGAAIPSEVVLRKCIAATGTPTHVKGIPPKRP